MLRFRLRIATKLAIVSGLGILLVAVMLVSQIVSNGYLGAAADRADRQSELLQAALEAKATVRGFQSGLGDARLAGNPLELAAADKYINANRDALQRLITAMQQSAKLEENAKRDLERIDALKDDGDNYYALSRQLVATKTEKLDIESKAVGADLSYADAAHVEALGADIDQIAQVKARPAAAAMAAVADELLQGVKQDAQIVKVASANLRAVMEYIVLGVSIFVIIVQFGTAAFGALSIAKPLRKIAAVLLDLTNDRVVEVPFRARGDEIGDIARATEIFKASIAQKVINFRVRAALDAVASNVMIADDQYNIMYMNTSLQKMLRENEAELRKGLPQFDSSKLIGASIDVFHKNPSHQRKLLDGLTGAFESHISVGSRKFQLIAAPVFNDGRQRVGTSVEWKDETAQKAVEGELDDLVKATVAGDFSKRVPLEGKTDFMLNLATAMNTLCENTGNALQDLVGMLGSLADGDMTPRITAEYHGMFGQLKDDANKMAERIGATVGEIKASAREVTNASTEISTSTTDLSQRTEEQAASLEQTSASMEEISATVKKNAENAQQANSSAATTRQVADRGGQVVAKAVEAMAKIEESSRKISDIIGVIDEIARQTNLLALNAAVEAARAGDAGRGFAVVASEVRSLAQRSSQAAKDIKNLITNSNNQVKDGVELVSEAGTALTQIVESIKQVADIVADIANASGEQASGIDQVNKALAQMDEVTQQNSALVEENAATAKTLEYQAKAMDERVGFFRIDVDAESGSPASVSTERSAVREMSPAASLAPQARRVVQAGRR
ncbi:MAG: methyl-accepting chemotaxis protein [Xanthobacteraceae bacterium]|jgi:methyl-accepting chemotaxis protein